jgi:ATP-dependent RNA helicase RhlE
MDFDMLGLQPRLVAKLAEQGITEPTPIQKKAIPHAMNGRDVMGLAQTGTGKTAAFGLPMIHALMSMGVAPAPKGVHGLILAPTRELANQIAENLRAYTQGTHLKVNIVVGGASINGQIHRLHRGTDLLVATPGRLIDLLDQKAVRLDQTRFLVLDEADQMLDMGFIHALRRIAPLLPKDRQTMLFSATMPKLMAELAQNYLRDPIRVEAAPPGKPADKVRQGLIFVEQSAKAELLIEKLDGHRNELALVFARTKHGAEKLMKTLDRAGFAAGSIHGNKSQGQRDRALAAFKAGELRVLVATDVAARGLDIPDVRHVYNYDLPNVPDNYVHRIGRTARAGRDGSALTFCSAAEMSELRAIEKVMGRPIPVLGGTSWEPERAPRAGRPGPSAKPARAAHPARNAAKPGAPAEGQKPARRRRPRGRGRVKQAA